MKVIYIGSIKRKANVFDNIIDKSKGIYDKIRNVFTDTDDSKDLIQGLQREEAEKQLADEFISNRDNSELFSDVDAESLQDFTEGQRQAISAIDSRRKLNIGYYTFFSEIYIEREILPLYLKYAAITGNTILISWCYDWGDYRAFIVDNIVFAEPSENQIME